MADDWARQAGRSLLILHVDHGLQPQSPAWAAACARLAARLGHRFQALAWTGAKPQAGLPAAARAARHRLLADAARAAGARVVLLGHTADDLRESRVMRAAGSTTPDAREWAPSPAWPEGRGVFLLRPLLGVGRTQLRAWLEARNQTWIDDPANIDLRYARSRARRSPGAVGAAQMARGALALAEQATHDVGIITLARSALRDAAPEDARRFVALASVCAGGGARRPATTRIDRAVEALRGPQPTAFTLAGARLEADDMTIRIFREAGETARGGLASLDLAKGSTCVWDGRFEVAAGQEGGVVRPLAGIARRVPASEQAILRRLPPATRGSLPGLVIEDRVTCPALTGEALSLIPDRFAAAAGLIDREAG